MTIQRFKKKQYRTKDKSLFHKWLKQEGYNRAGLSINLDVTPMTIDRYMREPERLTLKQIKTICESTNVDANFIIDRFNILMKNKLKSYKKLNKKTKERIFETLKDDKTIPEIAQIFNCSIITINRVIEERLKIKN